MQKEVCIHTEGVNGECIVYSNMNTVMGEYGQIGVPCGLALTLPGFVPAPPLSLAPIALPSPPTPTGKEGQ